ncbi:PspC domain-containing protein [Aeromicrobium sp. CF4.19]|uniref:PspC domain-containing protein n=1 Tax=Aeromicrobium sp. CF4.19 TaxID=3373082 RepID=UPI003EE652A7
MGKKLQRSTDDKWIGGVCGGVARYAGIDANLVRLIVVIATVLGLGSLILIYLLAWLIMPQQAPPGSQTIAHEPPPPSA